MNINGVLLKLDISNENDLNRYRQCLNGLCEGFDEIKDTKAISNKYKEAFYAMVICSFFDELFGKGTREKLFGDRPYYYRCFNALKQLQNEVINQKKDMRGLIIKFPSKK